MQEERRSNKTEVTVLPILDGLLPIFLRKLSGQGISFFAAHLYTGKEEGVRLLSGDPQARLGMFT